MTTTPSQSQTTAHTLSDEQRRELWSKIAVHETTTPANGRKRVPRLSFERSDVMVHATHPGGGGTTRTVYTHDLSAGGTSFLHPGFLHMGTSVSITLPRRLGGEETAAGRVVWCRHISGAWHGVGIKFAEPIFPKLFVSPAEWERLPNTDDVRPQDLAGNLLMIDDQEVDQMLFNHMLRETKLKVVAVDSIPKALEAVKGTAFDVVCTDLNLGIGQTTGEKGMEQIRAAGYHGPFVAISGDMTARLEGVKGLGVNLTLSKPYETEQLLSVLASALDAGGGQELMPLYSDLAGREGITPLLEQFCDKVQRALRDFKRFVDGNQLHEVRLICLMLRGSASGFGYPAVSAAAAEAVKALDASGDVTEAGANLQKMQMLCRRLTPAKKP